MGATSKKRSFRVPTPPGAGSFATCMLCCGQERSEVKKSQSATLAQKRRGARASSRSRRTHVAAARMRAARSLARAPSLARAQAATAEVRARSRPGARSPRGRTQNPHDRRPMIAAAQPRHCEEGWRLEFARESSLPGGRRVGTPPSLRERGCACGRSKRSKGEAQAKSQKQAERQPSALRLRRERSPRTRRGARGDSPPPGTSRPKRSRWGIAGQVRRCATSPAQRKNKKSPQKHQNQKNAKRHHAPGAQRYAGASLRLSELRRAQS